MKNTKRTFHIARIFLAVLLILVFLTGCGNAKTDATYSMKVTEATQDFYVNDFAGIFTQEQKANMMKKAVQLSDDYSGIQVVITTVKSLQECVTEEKNRVNIEQVAYSMYNQYEIGKDDMGILVLFSTEDRKVRIETGYQMQTYITDSKSGQLLDDYGMEYFRQDKFAEGLISLQDGIINEIVAVVPADWNDSQKPLQSTSPTVVQEDEVLEKEEASKRPDNGQVGWIIVFTIVVGSILIGLVLTIRKFFSFKRKLKESNDENEELKRQREEEIKYRKQVVQEMEESCTQRLIAEKKKHEREKEKLSCEVTKWCEAEKLAKSSAAKKEEELQDAINTMEGSIFALRQQLEELQEKYERMQKLHPEMDFEAEVKEMIEKEFQAAATEIDQELSRYLAMPADKDRISDFQTAINKYDGTDPEVKKYLKTNASELHALYEQSCTLKFKAEAETVDKKLAKYFEMSARKDRVSDFENAIHEYKSTPSEVQKYMKTDIEKLRQLCDESYSLKAEYERAEKEKRDEAEAQRVQEELAAVYRRVQRGTHENLQLLKEACQKYDHLDQEVKRFFMDDFLIQRLRSLLEEAEKDEKIWKGAKEAEEDIKRIVSRVGYSARESDKYQLERAMDIYRRLSHDQQAYVEGDLIGKLKRLIHQAEEDEEENRRRRNNFTSGSSSFGGSFGGSGFSGGGFGGFGGHSSGGGASRGF